MAIVVNGTTIADAIAATAFVFSHLKYYDSSYNHIGASCTILAGLRSGHQTIWAGNVWRFRLTLVFFVPFSSNGTNHVRFQLALENFADNDIVYAVKVLEKPCYRGAPSNSSRQPAWSPAITPVFFLRDSAARACDVEIINTAKTTRASVETSRWIYCSRRRKVAKKTRASPIHPIVEQPARSGHQTTWAGWFGGLMERTKSSSSLQPFSSNVCPSQEVSTLVPGSINDFHRKHAGVS